VKDFLHISHVEKLLYMTICHMEKFLHMTEVFSTSTACGVCDKYQVCDGDDYDDDDDDDDDDGSNTIWWSLLTLMAEKGKRVW